MAQSEEVINSLTEKVEACLKKDIDDSFDAKTENSLNGETIDSLNIKMSTEDKNISNCENIKKDIEKDVEVSIFSPPLYIQRYSKTKEILCNEPGIKKLVDFGSAEAKFFKYIKYLSSVEEIILVDIYEPVLESSLYVMRPLAWDYLFKRDLALTVKVFVGSVSLPDINVLQNVDAVTCIELIEHLKPEELENFPKSIFGIIQPKIVILTTPNSDYNVLFPNFKGFRHWDHKFEWTSKEFQKWCHDVITLYPQYTVEFSGVGDPPEKSKDIGYCTQIAIFRRTQPQEQIEDISNYEPYTLLKEYEYPAKTSK